MLLKINNRKYELTDLSISHTYGGVYASKSYRITNTKLLKNLSFPSNWGKRKSIKVLPVHEYLESRLPSYTIHAWIISEPFDLDSDGSELVITWLEESIEQNIKNLIKKQLNKIDWVSEAQDYEL